MTRFRDSGIGILASGLGRRDSGRSLRLRGTALRAFGKAPVVTGNPGHGQRLKDQASRLGYKQARPPAPHTVTATTNGLGLGLGQRKPMPNLGR